jgi:hypothetical protein
MTTGSKFNASMVLTDIRNLMFAEVITQPAAPTITVRREMFTLLGASLAEQAATVARLEAGAAEADRLKRDLAIAEADKANLELRLTIAEFLASRHLPAPVHIGLDMGREVKPSDASVAATRACFERDRAIYPSREKAQEERRFRTATIIDMSEAFGREQAARRSATDDGGAA